MASLRVGRTEIAYELKRTATAARRITVTPGLVEVSAPAGDEAADIEGFLHRKRQWIFNTVRELEEVTAGRPSVPRFMTGSKITFRGRRMSLVVRRHDGRHVEVSYANGFFVDLPSSVSAAAADAVVAMRIKLWLKRRVRLDAALIAAGYEQRFGLKPRALRVAEFVTGWGSCGAGGTVHIDWRLVFAPKAVLDYVVAHELAHLRERSHGPAFWDYLGVIAPNYARAKGWLDAHGGGLDGGFLDVLKR